MANDRFLLRILFTVKGKRHPPTRVTEEPDWNDLVVEATDEAVGGAAFYHIEKEGLEDRVPRYVFNALQKAYYINLKRYFSSLPEIKRILSCLRERSIPFIVLKGIALAEHLYPSAAMRGMSDLDILVRKDDVLKVDEAFSRLDYSPIDSTPEQALQNPPGYLASLEYYRSDASSLPVHLHWHLINTSVPATAFADRMNLDRIWEKSVSVPIAGVDSHILCPEHLIIYLCEHALRIGHSFDRLILILDIHQALNLYKKNLDWDFLIGEARDFGLQRFVFMALKIVGSYTGDEIPQGVMDALRPSRLSVFERLFLALQLRHRRVRGSSYLVYLAMNEGLLNRVRFVFRTFFPPAAILRQRSRVRKEGHPALFYFSRAAEVLGHFSRAFIFIEKKR